MPQLLQALAMLRFGVRKLAIIKNKVIVTCKVGNVDLYRSAFLVWSPMSQPVIAATAVLNVAQYW